MKFKVERAELVEKIALLLTKGKLMVNGRDNEVQIKKVWIDAFETTVRFIGANSPYLIFARTYLDAEVEEEGEDYLLDLNEFYDIIRGMNGKNVEVTINKSLIIINDGNRNSQLGKQTPPANVFDRIKQWDESNNFNGETIVITGRKDEQKLFIPWFEFSLKNQLKNISDVVLKKVQSDDVFIKTEGENVSFDCEKINTSRKEHFSFKTDILNEAGIELRYIYPIFNSVLDKVKFYYYISSRGIARIWAKCEDIEWMVISRQRKSE